MIRSKTTRLAEGVIMANPSPRIRVIWDNSHGEQHVIGYLGFDEAAHAEACYRWLVNRFSKYDRKTNSGANRPRKARRVEGSKYEIKWHSPDPATLATAIERDLARA